MRSFELRAADSRPITVTDWVSSRHSFSFGQHYDPANTHFGPLLAHNEDVLQPGPGYTRHPHRDVEILTWLIDGCLAHQDSSGHRQLIRPGMLQLLSAGSGVEHAESSGSADQPVHLVQMWLAAEPAGGQPRYSVAELGPSLVGGGLLPIASGLPEHAGQALVLRRPGAALYAARLAAGASVRLPAASYLHLFLTRGTVRLAGLGRLGAGDAARLTGTAGELVTATDPAELLAWQLPDSRP